MAGLRRDAPAPLSVRADLAARLAGHVREVFDPRWVLVPAQDRPSPLPPYTDRTADLHDALVAGEPVDVEGWRLRGIVEVPRGCRLVTVAADGTISPAAYVRVAAPPAGP